MLDKSNEKNAGEVKTAKDPEEVKTVDTTEGEKAAEAASVTEELEKNEAVEALVVAEESKAAKAAPVKEEPKKTGYHSELDGIEVEFELQYRDRETDMEDIAKRVTEDYARRGNDASAIELIQVYLKPTDYTAYYVINNSYEGKIPLF